MTRSLFTCLLALASPVLLPNYALADNNSVSGSAVIREMNLARQDPALYATYVEEMRAHFRGKEGVHAIDDAVRFLRSARPLPPFSASPGMCRSAADHCADQANGGMGHNGSGRSSPGARMSRYGTWSFSWGENISYGRMSARDVVLALIIDDGLPSRKHRQNIFNPNFTVAGAAYGPHARYRSVCSIDFAGGFTERGQVVAQNF